MAAKDVIGTTRPKRAISLEQQRKLLVSFKAGIAMALSGILLIYWDHLTIAPIGDLLDFLPSVLILFAYAVYALPTQVLITMEFIVASVTGCLFSLLVYPMLPNPHIVSYWILLPMFLVCVFIIAIDRHKKHVMWQKLTIIVFVVLGLLLPLTNLKDFGEVTLWAVVYSTILSVCCAILVSGAIFPIFHSHYVPRSVIEVIEESRNLYSDIALCLETITQLDVDKDDLRAKLNLEEAKKQMMRTEKELTLKINVLNTHMNGTAIEFWDIPTIGKYRALQDIVMRLAFQMIALQRIITTSEFIPHIFPVGVLREIHCEILHYLDHLADQAMRVHKIAHSKTTRETTWPDAEDMTRVMQEVNEAYSLIVREYRATGKPMPSRPIMRHAALAIGLMGLTKNLPVLTAKLQEIPPKTTRQAYKKVPMVILKCMVFSYKRMWNDFGFGILEEFSQKNSFKEHVVSLWKNLKLKFALQYSLAMTATLPWAIYLFEHHAEKLHMDGTNRIWLMTTVIIIILPSMGGSVGRCFHRIIGTAIGAPLAHLMGWAVMSVGGPHSPARWLTMEALFFVLMFLGMTVQQIPGTGYAAMLTTLTIFLIPTPYFHETLSHPPVYIFVTRIVFIAVTSLWVGLVFTILMPIKSVDNLESSLMDTMCTTGKAFTTLMRAGVIDENGLPECNISEETRKEVSAALKTLYTAQQNYATLLLDARFEVWILRRSYSKYAAAVQQAQEVYLSIASMLSAYGEGFSNDIKNHLVIPTRSSLFEAMEPIEKKVTEIGALRESNLRNRKKNPKLVIQQGAERLTKEETQQDEWHQIIDNTQPLKFQKILHDITEARRNFWKKQPLETIVPNDLLHFYAFVYSAGKFVNEWERLRQMILHIRFRKQLGVEGLGKKGEDIIVDKVEVEPGETMINMENLAQATATQAEHQEEIMTDEDKGGYFA